MSAPILSLMLFAMAVPSILEATILTEQLEKRRRREGDGRKGEDDEEEDDEAEEVEEKEEEEVVEVDKDEGCRRWSCGSGGGVGRA